jgi:hypothetical protein
MALLERVMGASRESRFFSSRASREARYLPSTTPETPSTPIFSESFLAQQQLQAEIDARMGALEPTGPLRHGGFGQDRTVEVMPTENGEYVVKTLKQTSRANLIFGLGIPAAEVPPDTDKTGAREHIVALHSGRTVDPYEVAEKVRLVHVMATTYLDQGDKVIWTTATLVKDGKVENRQRYLPRLETVMLRDPREIDLEEQEKVKLFRELQDRWKKMIVTPDFRQLPADVQDYWRTYPPDSGYGTNARFLGLGNVVAIDY